MSNRSSLASSKPVALWLLIGVGMIIVQIALGGITRLTGSGLSITEWNVVTGTLPPLNQQDWMTEFEKYRQTPQYHLLNFDFTLKDFKFIFFWEWLHRFWARLIGVVFVIPFFIFLAQRRFKPEMVKPMIILFLLGALQGAVGWIMVASGLTGDAIFVKPTRLALHFIFALGLLCYTFWFALQLMINKEELVADRSAWKLTASTIGVLSIQLIYGALMAGNKAATSAPTWPDINGHMIPGGMMDYDVGLLNLLDNKITIHFIHRGLAYLLLVMVIILSIRLFRTRGTALYRKLRLWPLLLTVIQVLLGIFAVLTSITVIPNNWGIFEWLAQLHQLVAMFLLLSLVAILYIVQNRNTLTGS